MRRVAGLLGAMLAATTLVGAAVGDETHPFLRGSWAEIRAAHAGRPTIVHVWGMSCGPCLAELPDWAIFLRAHPGADFVLVNGDRPGDDRQGLVDERLAKAGLRELERWRFAEPHLDRLRFEIDPAWQGELPYTLLIARDGAITSFSGSADFSELSGWLETQTR